MTKISIPELKKQLKTYKADELVSIIVDCYKSSSDVKSYIHMMLEPESTEDQLFDEATKKYYISFTQSAVNLSLNWLKRKKLFLNSASFVIMKRER